MFSISIREYELLAKNSRRLILESGNPEHSDSTGSDSLSQRWEKKAPMTNINSNFQSCRWQLWWHHHHDILTSYGNIESKQQSEWLKLGDTEMIIIPWRRSGWHHCQCDNNWLGLNVWKLLTLLEGGRGRFLGARRHQAPLSSSTLTHLHQHPPNTHIPTP